MNNQKEIEELKATAKKLSEQIAELEQASNPWPQKGDTVYLVSTMGRIDCYCYRNDKVDKARIKQGRLFETKAEARWFSTYEQKQAQKLKVLYELEQWAAEYNAGETTLPYELYYDTRADEVTMTNDYHNAISNDLPRFRRNCSRELLKHFGNRLNVLFGG